MSQYNQITFPGSLLQPGFSIYLWEIVHRSGRYFYVGMAGDNFYPSARSAIHRLSGHFERKKNSTQNQMKLAMLEKEFELSEIKITMHHWIVPGFTPWGESLGNFKPNALDNRRIEDYNAYKEKQQAVLKLERYLIKRVQEKVGREFSLNKTLSSIEKPDESFAQII